MLSDFLTTLSGLLTTDPPVEAPTWHTDPDGRGTSALVREGYRVEKRAGGDVAVVVHTFHDPESLCGWLNRYADPQEAQILVDDDAVTASADRVDADGFQLTMPLDYGLEAGAWFNAFSRSHDQRGMFRLIQAQQADFPGNVGADMLGQLMTLDACRGGEVKSSLNAHGGYNLAVATDRRDVNAKLPPSFHVVIPIYDGVRLVEEGEAGTVAGELAVYSVEVFLRLEVSDRGQIVMQLECPGWDKAVKDAQRDLVAYMRHLLEDGFLVGRGCHGKRLVKVA